MGKISLSEATRLVPVSKSTLYRDATERKFSWEKDQKGRKVVDPAELERFYGKLNPPQPSPSSNGNSQSDPLSQNGNNKIVPLLEQKIEFLESQLSDMKERESEWGREKEKLLGILEKQTLMLEDKREPVAPIPDPEKVKNYPSWFYHPWVTYPVAIVLAMLCAGMVFRGLIWYFFQSLLP